MTMQMHGSTVEPVTAPNSVFLSYGHDPDCTELANRLYASLKAAGYQPWMDKPPDDHGGISFNEDWRERIRSEIRGSSHIRRIEGCCKSITTLKDVTAIGLLLLSRAQPFLMYS